MEYVNDELEFLRKLEQTIKEWGPFDIDHDELLRTIHYRIMEVLEEELYAPDSKGEDQ